MSVANRAKIDSRVDYTYYETNYLYAKQRKQEQQSA
jgi:hypothetical protein